MVDADIDYDAPPPEPLEWTPERAGALVRGFGFVLHSADGLAHEPGGEELWRATMADAEAIGPPLARILNRYAPARRLAGVSDEAELAFGVVPYVKRNLQLRGRLHRERVEREAWLAGEGEPPASERPPE